MSKVYADATTALSGLLKDGMTIMAGGFGLCGMPETLIDAIQDSGVRDLTLISNNAGVDGIGLGKLLATRQIRRMVASYAGENRLFQELAQAGEIEVEFVPQGTLAERIRAGGAGIPAFFTPTGAGTTVAEGKEVRVFDGRDCILETALTADLAVVKAWKGDGAGNLVFRKTARNFNPLVATAGRVTVAEVEILEDVGAIAPDHVHTPGLFVQRVVRSSGTAKRIEKRTTRPRP